MSPTFTTRTPTPDQAATKKTVAKTTASPSSRRHTWRLRVVRAMRWTIRQMRLLRSRVSRYMSGLTRIQRIWHAVIILGCIVLLVVLAQVLDRKPHSTQSPQSGNSSTELPKETPSFSTILPSGKSASDYGGWTRVSPSDRNAVYAYTDSLAGTSIIISEQPLPDSFSSDPSGSIQKLAESYSADRTFEAGSTTVYIGKSAKGPQSLIFTKHGLLILIKSSSTISDDQWKSYITLLQ